MSLPLALLGAFLCGNYCSTGLPIKQVTAPLTLLSKRCPRVCLRVLGSCARKRHARIPLLPLRQPLRRHLTSPSSLGAPQDFPITSRLAGVTSTTWMPVCTFPRKGAHSSCRIPALGCFVSAWEASAHRVLDPLGQLGTPSLPRSVVRGSCARLFRQCPLGSCP